MGHTAQELSTSSLSLGGAEAVVKPRRNSRIDTSSEARGKAVRPYKASRP